MLSMTATGALLATSAHAYGRYYPHTREACVAQIASAILLSAVGRHALHWKLAMAGLLLGCAWRDRKHLPIALSLSVAVHALMERCWKRGLLTLMTLSSWAGPTVEQRVQDLERDFSEEKHAALLADLREARRHLTRSTPEEVAILELLDRVHMWPLKLIAAKDPITDHHRALFKQYQKGMDFREYTSPIPILKSSS